MANDKTKVDVRRLLWYQNGKDKEMLRVNFFI
jgi:hypothetical protein